MLTYSTLCILTQQFIEMYNHLSDACMYHWQLLLLCNIFFSKLVLIISSFSGDKSKQKEVGFSVAELITREIECVSTLKNIT